MENEIKQKTNSLWNFLNPDDLKNHFYEKTEQFLIPDTSMSSMKLWEEWFMRHNKSLKKNLNKNTKEFYQYIIFYV